MGDVIDFPDKKPKKQIDPNIEMTHILIQNFIDTLKEYGYDLSHSGTKKDIAVLVNVFFAILQRNDGKLHFLQSMLDDLGEFYDGD
jgi:N-acetyl-anhydromuramyl-L-alanine amidase AmpD